MARKDVRTPRRRMTMAKSDAMLNHARRSMVSRPMILVEDLGAPRMKLFTPDDQRKLNVDERYQRVRVTAMVNELIHVLKAGGKIADPISVAERLDGTWWIVDGQQRHWAASECNVDLQGAIYKVASFDQERTLFLALNRKATVKPNTICRAWTGPAGEMLRAVVGEGGPLEGRVSVRWASEGIMESLTFVRSALAATTGIVGSKGAERVLTRLDGELKQRSGARQVVEAFARLVAETFADCHPRDSRPPALAVFALGLVAYDRWKNGVTKMPPAGNLHRLRGIKWRNVAPTSAERFMPLFIEEINKRWPRT